LRIIAFWLFVGCALPCGAGTVTLRFAHEGVTLFPYYLAADSATPDKPGAMLQILKLLETRIPDLKVEVQHMPWRRCLAKLEAGEIDAVESSFNAGRMVNGVFPMRAGQVDGRLRIHTLSYSMFATGDSGLRWDGQSFRGLDGAIGAPLGYSIVGDLKAKGLRVEESNSTVTDFQKLLLGRLDGVAAQSHVGEHLIKQERFKAIVKLEPALASKDYYLLLSHQFVANHPELSKRIWHELAQIRDNEMAAIMARYQE
jgi:polar amino acid transport system substrate-binding protein